jgi:hypothetical protein
MKIRCLSTEEFKLKLFRGSTWEFGTGTNISINPSNRRVKILSKLANNIILNPMEVLRGVEIKNFYEEIILVPNETYMFKAHNNISNPLCLELDWYEENSKQGKNR